MKRAFQVLSCIGLFAGVFGLMPLHALEQSVSVEFVIVRPEAANAKPAAEHAIDASNVVVWLSPLDRTADTSGGFPARKETPKLVQRNKTFEPHVLVVPVGTAVEFPNRDPFFHNIFSLYDGKRFDLGLYESGTSRSVRFDRPGVSYLFCNIHAEMSAVVIALDTPYFAISNRAGEAVMRDVPDGAYRLSVWDERASPEELKELARTITVGETRRNLGTMRIRETASAPPPHKNKYGLDYVPPPKSDYDRP